MLEFSRMDRLIGEDAAKRIARSSVIIFGLGGVGSYIAEALARCGTGAITLVDGDKVDITNINRQLYALHSTVGLMKTAVAKDRITDINPACRVERIDKMYLPENSGEFDLSGYDCIIDAVDCVSAKIDLAQKAEQLGIHIISVMGTGNKLNPAGFEVSDIYKTSVCPLCRVMRRELKKRGVKSLKTIYSREEPKTDGERSPASIAFVPAAAGLLAASEAIKYLAGY